MIWSIRPAEVRFVFASLLLFVAPGVRAQAPGDIAITGSDTSRIGVLGPTGGIRTVRAPQGFGGGSTSCVHWTATAPGGVYVGGDGFVGRLEFGPVSADYTPLANVAGPAALAAGSAGALWIADSQRQELALLDPVTGDVESVLDWSTVGSLINAIAIDRQSGDIYIGGTNEIWRVPGGDGTPVLFAAGWSTGSSSFVSGLVVDLLGGGVHATILNDNRVVTIDPAGTLTDLIPPGTLPATNAISYDASLDLIVGSAGQVITRIPILTGGAPSRLASGTAFGGAATGVSVIGGVEGVGRVVWQTNQPEARLSAAGAVASALRPARRTLAATGDTAAVTFATDLPGATWDLAVAFAPSQPAVTSFPNGDLVNVDLARVTFFNGGFASSGLTSTTLTVQGLSGVTASAQLVVLNPATPGGASLSAATQVRTN